MPWPLKLLTYTRERGGGGGGYVILGQKNRITGIWELDQVWNVHYVYFTAVFLAKRLTCQILVSWFVIFSCTIKVVQEKITVYTFIILILPFSMSPLTAFSFQSLYINNVLFRKFRGLPPVCVCLWYDIVLKTYALLQKILLKEYLFTISGINPLGKSPFSLLAPFFKTGNSEPFIIIL